VTPLVEYEWKLTLTKSDLAKYPFLQEAAEYVRSLDLKIEELANPEYDPIVDRAEERLQEAILYALVTSKSRKEDIEILSFPVAVMMAAATKDSFIQKRYALAEAKRAYALLRLEAKEKLMKIAENFDWRISLVPPTAEVGPAYTFALHFADYLKNTRRFREKKWKLVNKLLLGGRVFLTKNEAARLLSEEIRRHIETRLETRGLPELPQGVAKRVERLRLLSTERKAKAELEEIPKSVVTAAFPPCIKALYDMTDSGRHLSHIGRFALTSFLINVGMSVESVVDLFRNLSDFNERLTVYQVEHIAGERGSRTRYIPPSCDTLKTHGVCVNPDETCKVVRHPLAYYRRKSRLLRSISRQK